MILDIAHLCFNTLDFTACQEELINMSYTLQFEEFNLPNLACKTEFLEQRHKNHDLALYQKPGCFSIELLNHHNITGQPGYLQVKGVKGHTMHGGSVLGSLPADDFDRIVIPSGNNLELCDFLSHLGFTQAGLGNEYKVMEFSSLFKKKTFSILTTHADTGHNYHLDDSGFTCLTLLSNSAQREHRSLSKTACHLSDIEVLMVNDRILELFFVRTPGGEIFEIYSLK